MSQLALPVVLTSLLLCCLTAQDCAAQEDAQDKVDWSKLEAQAARAKVAKIFAASCASCHLPPDVRFATDRIWIAQLMDTA